MMKELTPQEKANIINCIKRVQELLNLNVIENQKDLPHKKSVLIEILILLNDLLCQADKLGHRVTFTDDVVVNKKLKIADVTDLIKNFRDAVCHSNTFRNKVGESGILGFGLYYGKGAGIKFGDIYLGSVYNDDVAINVGENIIYLRRHITRAFLEVDAYFAPLVKT